MVEVVQKWHYGDTSLVTFVVQLHRVARYSHLPVGDDRRDCIS